MQIHFASPASLLGAPLPFRYQQDQLRSQLGHRAAVLREQDTLGANDLAHWPRRLRKSK